MPLATCEISEQVIRSRGNDGLSTMADSHSSDSLSALRVALRDTFASEFQLWLETSRCWERLHPDKAGIAGDFESTPLVVMTREPMLRKTKHPDQTELAIPLRLPNGSRAVAVGHLPTAEADLALRCARLFTGDWSKQQQLVERDEELRAFVGQISCDFEELTFLRRLADHLEIAEVCDDAWQVARAILPMLRHLIHAEYLVLATAGPDKQDPSTCQLIVREGAPCLPDATLLALIAEYGDAAEGQPIVKNHFAQREAKGRFPGVDAFILQSVARGEFRLGWILAVNRQQHSSTALANLDLANEFGTVEASLLSSSAAMLATHGRNVQLFKEKAALLVSVVRALVSALDAKDPYTCGHSERVALISQCLGRELNLVDTACERLYLTGLLHDIGKIGVRDVVLRKPGSLDNDELTEMRRHPLDGWAILQDLDQLKYVLPGVLHHHEHFDGSGYPDGLTGEQIPLDARILAVADSYDAMTSDRPYRKGMTHDVVDDILRSGAERQWDPRVIDAFFRAKADIIDICRSYQPHARKERESACLPIA